VYFGFIFLPDLYLKPFLLLAKYKDLLTKLANLEDSSDQNKTPPFLSKIKLRLAAYATNFPEQTRQQDLYGCLFGQELRG